MKRIFPLLILSFAAVAAVAQTVERAVPAYSINEKLIGLSNLTDGLSECSIRSASGKVKDIEMMGETVEVKVKVDKKTSATAIVPLERISEDDRKSLFRHLITKNNIIRLSGYGCDTEKPFTAFSVDRVY